VKRLQHVMSFITCNPNMELLLTQECAVKRGISSVSLEVVTLKQRNKQKHNPKLLKSITSFLLCRGLCLQSTSQLQDTGSSLTKIATLICGEIPHLQQPRMGDCFTTHGLQN